ncbi:hypothetical protein Scep_014179 [Stephania cephalantha]|uniref:Chaperonin-like RbcX protein n=1 Tax=Stephania cephalantha TaxID=152367 RepID=A0AAP0P041_9MAGN
MMVGALPVVGSSILDSHACPCVCLDAQSSSKGGYDLGQCRNMFGRKQLRRGQPGRLELSSSFVDAWYETRLSARVFSAVVNRCMYKQRESCSPVVVNELGGQYDDSFEDVKAQMMNYITYKAIRTVLNQLYEMNPTQYRWFYDFIVTNKPGDGKLFIRNLVKEKQELAERVMVTRLHLYGKWVKKCDHAAMYQKISDENLELMRERLIQTVIWPSDDSSTEKIG